MKQLVEALKIQELTGKKLGSILVELGYLDSRKLSQILANLYKVPSIDLEQNRVKVEMARVISEDYCRQKHILPVQVKNKTLTIAISKPDDYSILREVEFITNLTVTPVVAPEGSIDKAIEDLFSRAKKDPGVLYSESLSGERPQDDYFLSMEVQSPTDRGLSPSQTAAPEADEALPLPPVISDEDLKSFISTEEVLDEVERHLGVEEDTGTQTLHREISQAIEKGATHMHFELNDQNFEIRARIQGEMQKLTTLPKYLFQPMVRELKLMADVDPTSRRHPQTGFFKFSYRQEEIPITAHFFPYGDLVRVVLYLQRNFDPAWSLDHLGFSVETLKSFREVLASSRGVTVFCGPPGHGKTTTIYAALRELVSEKKVIMTYESPVSYRLNGIIQTEPQDKHGDNYVTGLSKILDQNPDVLYMDRVADPPSIQWLFNEASSHSRIFIRSTLENPVGVLAYLLELLRSPHALTASLNAILSQRLVNCLCPHCKSTYKPSPRTEERIKKLLGVESFVLYKSDGCEGCAHTGFLGQTAIFELLLINEKTKSRIITEQKEPLYPVPSEMVLRKIFYSPETMTMMKDGLRKALEGVTTIAEVVRVAGLGSYE